ncbi:hypothetical protein SI859A1_00974 [Aurantimonas manganoxydans SI85-9A1]|uniref:Uncharacterized protein n=1 Tax=Aurantimonas manganoxydans (strain ATCC BAA-1229 / DSM 21871 / SI85-9A1) TaxID=287752 RepID=Q1YJM4_AURMS|nr:hypothetical protein SI859A1_00974 [Aurantimonas manganoxydans SI85-9A1]
MAAIKRDSSRPGRTGEAGFMSGPSRAVPGMFRSMANFSAGRALKGSHDGDGREGVTNRAARANTGRRDRQRCRPIKGLEGGFHGPSLSQSRTGRLACRRPDRLGAAGFGAGQQGYGEVLRRGAGRPERLRRRPGHDLRRHVQRRLPGQCLEGGAGWDLRNHGRAGRPHGLDRAADPRRAELTRP